MEIKKNVIIQFTAVASILDQSGSPKNEAQIFLHNVKLNHKINVKKIIKF